MVLMKSCFWPVKIFIYDANVPPSIFESLRLRVPFDGPLQLDIGKCYNE